MEAKERARIEKVLSEAFELTETGVDEYEAARNALAGCPSYVSRELAVAAIVDSTRRRQRLSTLGVERRAEGRLDSTNWESALTPSAAGVRRGTRAYDRWLTETPNGQKYAREEEEFESRKTRMITGFIDDFARHLRIEWTTELLGSEFALPDGSKTTWGAATVDQHMQRAAMFQRNAMANAEGAARHVKAIEDLKAAGKESLNDLVGVAA